MRPPRSGNVVVSYYVMREGASFQLRLRTFFSRYFETIAAMAIEVLRKPLPLNEKSICRNHAVGFREARLARRALPRTGAGRRRNKRIPREARVGHQVAEIGAAAERIEVALGRDLREETIRIGLDGPPEVSHGPRFELLTVLGSAVIEQGRYQGARTGQAVEVARVRVAQRLGDGERFPGASQGLDRPLGISQRSGQKSEAHAMRAGQPRIAGQGLSQRLKSLARLVKIDNGGREPFLCAGLDSGVQEALGLGDFGGVDVAGPDVGNRAMATFPRGAEVHR
jgi:hypothetical protein